MAQKCYRHGGEHQLNFIGEQFWGRAAPGVPDSKEFQDARYFLGYFRGGAILTPTNR